MRTIVVAVLGREQWRREHDRLGFGTHQAKADATFLRIFILATMLLGLSISMSCGEGLEPSADSPQSEGSEIRLKSRTFAPPTKIELESALAATLEARAHVLIQFDRIPDSDARTALEDAGIKLLHYIPKNSWFASVPTDLSPDSSALSLIRWIGEILPEDKMSSGVAGIGRRTGSTGGDVLLVIKSFKDVPIDALRETLTQHGAVVIGEASMADSIAIAISEERITDLAREDLVRWIEPAPRTTGSEVSPSSIRTHIQTGDAQSELQLSGDGVTVGVFEDSHAYTNHPDLVGRTSIGDADAINYFYHATMVAGIIGGDGTDTYDFRGMAPDVDIYTYDFSSGVPTEHQNYLNDLQTGVGSHLIDIANNSWGDYGCQDFAYGAYVGISPMLDSVVRGAFGSPLTVVFSAGNERDGFYNEDTEAGNDLSCVGSAPDNVNPPYKNYQTLNHPKSAKNTIVVGAIDSYNNKMSTYSSWGPTLDGRIKPDIVASGLHNGTDTNGSGTTDATEFNHHYRAANYPTNDYVYGWLGQTSTAAAATSGAIALLLEDHRTQFPLLAEPLPSTVRALLIHTALDLDDGTDWYNKGPDYASGFGLLQIKSAIDHMRTGSFLEDSVDDGQTVWHLFSVPSTASAVKVTLAWDDPPGAENASPALVNDLDLILLNPRGIQQLYPWTLSPSNPSSPAENTRGDHTNNVEQYLVESQGGMEPGNWIIGVYGSSVPEGPQRFSLVFDELDSDGDGIVDAVDTEPLVYSDDFADAVGTSGSIVTRGDQVLRVLEFTDPQGVGITTDPGHGPEFATVSACGNTMLASFESGERASITCSSVETHATAGTIGITFLDANEPFATTNLSAPNALSFDPNTNTFTASAGNSGDLVITVEGQDYPIAPGEQISFSGALATIVVQDLNGDPGIQCPGTNCSDGTYAIEDFADLMRITLGGMHHDDGADIGMQDCNSDVRWTILEAHPDLFVGTCTDASCDHVQHAWRLPDDDPGMDTFLQLLGLPAIDEAPFCNGDELEDNDPIRRACADGEDVCQPDGTLGWVLPIVPGPGSTEPCSLGVFRWKILPFTRFECPQGINPLFGLCLQPQDAQENFGCLNPAFNKSFGTPAGVDGRVHNLWPLNADGTAPIANGKELVAAFDRIHTANTIAPGASVCLEPAASDRIDCLTEASPCSLGTECNGEPGLFACSEQGIRDAIAAGGGPHYFDCPQSGQTIYTNEEILIDKDVILDGEQRLTLDGQGTHRVFTVDSGVEAHLARMNVLHGSSSADGGCIYNSGTLELQTIVLTNCVASGSDGGAIANWGILELAGSFVAENEARRSGGGIYNAGSLTVRQSTLVQNKARSDGGAIMNYSRTDLLVKMTVIDSALVANAVLDEDGDPAGLGGAIYSRRGTGEVINTTVTQNAAALGGAIWADEGDFTLAASTVAWNWTTEQDSSRDIVHRGDGSLGVWNTAIVGDDCSVNSQTSQVVGQYSVESPGNTCMLEGLLESQGGVDEDAVALGELAPNGWPVWSYLPAPGSVLLDKIPDAYCWTDADQRSVPRPQGSACDIGAVERSPSDPIPCTEAGLREAVARGGWHTFSCDQPIMTTSEIVIDNTNPETWFFMLEGDGQGLTVQGAGDHPVFRMAYWEPCEPFGPPDARFRNVTITGGNPGIVNDGCSLDLVEVQITGNAGGIENNGVLELRESTVSGNSAEYGAGIRNSYELYISDSTISGNNAYSTVGGGIWNMGNMNIENSTISGNTAELDGAAIYNGQYGEGNIMFSTITRNTVATPGGGDIYNDDPFGYEYLRITKSLIDGNCSLPSLASVGYNIESPGNTCGLGVDGTSSVSVNPVRVRLGDLQNNGGPTDTHLPLLPAATNLAIDYIPEGQCGYSWEDQRDVSRPQPAGGWCDVGSVEVEGPSSYAPVLTSLDHALIDLNECGIPNSSTFRYTMDFSDPDGDVTPSGARVFVDLERSDGFTLPYESDSIYNTVTGDGFSGSVEALNCLWFESASWADVTVTIHDAAGNPSNSLTTRIPKPDGAL